MAKRNGWRLLFGLLLLLAVARPVAAQTTPAALLISVDSNGHYTLQSSVPQLTFGGDIGQPLANLRSADGQDTLGAFHEVDFDYAARSGSIRAYLQTPVVLFSTTFVGGGPNTDPFPVLTSLPNLPYTLSYHDTPFSPYQLNTLADAQDSPWLFFDPSGSGFLISPAANFPVARMAFNEAGLSSGIDSSVARLPAGYTEQTLLVTGSGPNQMFDTWGTAMLALHNKTRPANDADLTLAKLGYWTDNGAAYYYHFEPQLGYAGTLLAVKRDFDQRGIALGYLQLDSWWYPKGPAMRWDDLADGIFRYRAAADLFPDGLPAFQQQLGLPLATHARWIDPSSPYRSEFSFSGNVMTDPRYWSDLMSYLKSSGVVMYEQDWLGAQAQPVYDLSAPQQFMGNMASEAALNGMTLQYCMPLPRHVLQTVEYGNVTSMRVSDDRFDRNRWDTFLYTSRLASSLGVWPWADVFMSTERDNLLLAALSGGVVGIGDPLGAENADNLRHVVRADAVLVKPDAPLVPTDESVVLEAAQGTRSPMVAWTYSDHAANTTSPAPSAPGAGTAARRGQSDDMQSSTSRTAYVFAYSRGNGPQVASFDPASLGVGGEAYVYDYFADIGQVVEPGSRFSASVQSGSYYVVAPVGASGIAFLGDAGEFVSLGAKRISALADDGVVHATVEFAAGEDAVTLQGFAPAPPTVTASNGAADPPTYDFATQRFHVVLHPASTATSNVSVAISLP
jgi:hypothetical protein